MFGGVPKVLPYERYNLTTEEYDQAHRFFQGILVDKQLPIVNKMDNIMGFIGLFKSKYVLTSEYNEIEVKKSRNIEECGKCIGYCCAPLRCCGKSTRIVVKLLIYLLILSSIAFIAFFISKKFYGYDMTKSYTATSNTFNAHNPSSFD